MSDPMFVMSMYANKTDLYEAKAKYYMEKSESLQAEVKRLKDLVREHLYAPDNQKIREWEDLAKRSRAAIWDCSG
jgi:hypothetical protein